MPQAERFQAEFDVYYDNKLVGRVQGIDYRDCYQKGVTLCQTHGVGQDVNKIKLDSELKKVNNWL